MCVCRGQRVFLEPDIGIYHEVIWNMSLFSNLMVILNQVVKHLAPLSSERLSMAPLPRLFHNCLCSWLTTCFSAHALEKPSHEDTRGRVWGCASRSLGKCNNQKRPTCLSAGRWLWSVREQYSKIPKNKRDLYVPTSTNPPDVFLKEKKKKKQASCRNVTHHLRSLLTTQRFGKHKAIFCVSIAANVCMKLRKQRKSSKSLRRSPQPWRGCQKGPQLYLWGQALCDILCIFQMFLTDTKMCYRNLSWYYLSSSLY